MPIPKAATVRTSCNLLKLSLKISNVFEGATLVRKRSSPYARTIEVDSSKAGDVTIFWVLATYMNVRMAFLELSIGPTW